MRFAGVRTAGLLAVATLAAALLAGCSSGQVPGPTLPPPSDTPRSPLTFASLDPANRPPTPAQWAGGSGGIPSNQWWSAAVVGPGSRTLWSTPLATRIDPDGTISFSNEGGETRDDGTVATPFIPALFVETPVGGADTAVVGYGDLHVRLRLTGRSAETTTELTLTRGNVLAELVIDGPEMGMFVPGLKLADSEERWATIDTGEGRWVLATDQPVTWSAVGDRLTVHAATDRFNLVLGPAPSAPPAKSPPFVDVAVAVAAQPVTATSEALTVDERGRTTQTLQVSRTQDTPTPLALLPHQQTRIAAAAGPTLGRVEDAQGTLAVVLTTRLHVAYAPVPVLWSAVTDSAAQPADGTALPADGTAQPGAPLAADGPAGSYFGGKYAYTAATLADLAAGDHESRLDALSLVRRQFDRLAGPPHEAAAGGVAWEPAWGAVVLQPTEFGAGTELNDHQLQYGYWVAAASILAEADPAWAETNRALIDALIADYAGAATVPEPPIGLPERRTWSPYDGHSWASGVVPFDDGNNLESISESAFSSWAAARWFLVTGRPDPAATFVARFTIENAVASGRWLPAAPLAPGARPWSGVVWAAKVDNATWFDARPEAALGIRLLPLSPASLARYPDAESQRAARVRWAWCDRFGGGCGGLWPNLLGSDAVVAGHATPRGTGEAESSTSEAMTQWWADLWSGHAPAEGWSCTPAAIARVSSGGAVSVLAANPTRQRQELRCWDAAGKLRWSRTLTPAERGVYPVS